MQKKYLVYKEWCTQKQSLTFGLTVPERDRTFIFGHETSATWEAKNPAWFWLVGALRTELAWSEAISGKLTSGTLTCVTNKTNLYLLSGVVLFFFFHCHWSSNRMVNEISLYIGPESSQSEYSESKHHQMSAYWLKENLWRWIKLSFTLYEYLVIHFWHFFISVIFLIGSLADLMSFGNQWMAH